MTELIITGDHAERYAVIDRTTAAHRTTGKARYELVESYLHFSVILFEGHRQRALTGTENILTAT